MNWLKDTYFTVVQWSPIIVAVALIIALVYLAVTAAAIFVAFLVNLNLTADQWWLIGGALVVIMGFIAYLIPVVKQKHEFDLDELLPLLLECAGAVAALRMTTLAFTLQNVADTINIFIGGLVFLAAIGHMAIKTIVKVYME